jgi:hypothetical protein
MLSNSSVTIGTNLAEIISDANIKLVPKQSTLLQELTSSVTNNLFSKVDKREYIEPTILQASLGNEVVVKNIKSYSQSTHDTIMDNYIEDLANIVTNHISFSRNVVNKEINKLKEKVQEGLSSFKYKDAEDFFSITYFKLQDVFRSFIIENEISTYKGATNKFFYDTVDLSKIDRTEFDLLTYILTGDEEQDKYISTWFSALGKEKALGYIIDNVPEYSLSVNNLLDYSLINYLFYRNLLSKSDLELGYSSIQMKSKAVANKDYFGNKLAISIEFYQKDIRNNKLLTSDSETAFSYFNDKPLSITVYEESFVKLAEGGCSIEVLFGFISSENRNNITTDELIANKENYLTKWNNTRSLYLISMNNSKLDIFKQILRTKFEESITELSEEETETSKTSPEYTADTRKMGNDYIDQLQLSEIDDLDKITLDLVAKFRFRFTNAYFLLNEMSEILKMSDKIDPLEAALFASVKYVTDFLLEQTETVRM